MSLKDIWDTITGAKTREDEAYREASVKSMDNKEREKQAEKDYAAARLEKQQQDKTNAVEFRDKNKSPSERLGSDNVADKVKERIKPQQRGSSEKSQERQTEPDAATMPQPKIADSMLEPLSAKEQDQWRKAYGEAKVNLHHDNDRGRKL